MDHPGVFNKFQQFLNGLSTKLCCSKVNLEFAHLESVYMNLPIVTCLKGGDGKEDHTVAIYKGWIYDGNFPCALQLSFDSLSLCCSTDEQQCCFDKFVNSYVLHLFDDYLKQNDSNKRNAKKHKNLNRQKKLWKTSNS